MNKDGRKFSYRVAGIVIKDNKILLHRLNDEAHWSLAGGKVEFGETSEEALKREFQEELEVEPISVTYRGIIENIYRYSNSDFHQIGLYYDVQGGGILSDTDKSFDKQEGNDVLEFRWFSLDDFNNIALMPSVLKNIVTSNEKNFHVINKEI